jgi:orotate phosphoribosyltransferase
MHLVPTSKEILELLERTGALRTGHFEYPDGYCSYQHLQLPLVLRFHEHAKTLAVALSRHLRRNSELRAIIGRLSLVTPSPNGLPIAYTMCEALKAKQVYWAEPRGEDLAFPQYIEPRPGEKVLMVDDIYRTGKKFTHLRRLLEQGGAEVVGIAVLIEHPTPNAERLDDLPMFSLATLEPLMPPGNMATVPVETVRL